jgi:citrate synthase
MAWKTSITDVSAGKVSVRGYAIEDLMSGVPYPDVAFLLLTGQLPSPAQSRVLNAILVSVCDQGALPHSTTATINSASTRAALLPAVASGLLAMGPAHAGAVERAAWLFDEGVKKMKEKERSAAEQAKVILEVAEEKKERLAGFGHLLHKSGDPRALALVEIARREGVAGDHVALMEAIHSRFRERGKTLPLNVDGAMAAVALDLGIPWELANALFAISRLPGLAAHYLEEVRTQRPMRAVDPEGAVYEGPPPRALPERYGD